MQIQVNTDAHINGSATLAAEVEAMIDGALGRFQPQLTRVEAFISDVNGHKTGNNDIRCVVEARLSGIDPIAGTHEAGSIAEALDGAIERVERQIDKTVERLGHHKGRTSYGGEPPP